MGVPFEALLPYGIMVAFFGVTGVSLTTIRWFSNQEKRPRYGIDKWDRQSEKTGAPSLLQKLSNAVIERDFRLTGVKRGQTDSVEAPPGFEVSNPWKMEHRIL